MSTVEDVPISQLPAAATLSGSEQLPMVQGGQTVRGTVGGVAAHVIANLPSTPDLTPPPDVTSLTVNPAISHILVTFDAPTYTQGHGNGRTDIYAVQRSPTSTDPEPTFSSAILVGSALDASPILAIPSNPDVEWHVWAKYVSVDGVASPDAAGGTNGVVATTGQDVSTLLNALTGQITSSQLYSALGAQINLISAPSTTAGSVAAQVLGETNARVAALTAEAGFRSTGDSTTLASAETYTQTWAYSKSATDSAIAAEGATITTAFTAADAATLSSAQNYTYSQAAINSAIAASAASLTTSYTAADATVLSSAQSFTYSRSAIDSAIATSSASLTTSFTAADAAVLSNAESFTYSRSAIDGAIATSASTLTTAYGTAISSAISSEATTRASADTALSNSITTLSSTVSGNTSAISTEATTRATADGELFAQYTVKLDTNGYVSGFGLASTSTGATPYSEFIVRADSFSIASPSGPGISPIVPFVVQTTSTTINGQTVPPGVYMNAAYIMNGTITTAMIGLAEIDDALIANVSAAKLTAGAVEVGAYIESTGFSPGSSGWKISGNGNVEFWGTSAVFGGALSAATGTFGDVTIAAGGSISSGQTAYDTGTGFWLGEVAGTPKFSIGNPSGSYLTWDGTTLTIVNAAVTTPTLTLPSYSASVTGGNLTTSVANGTHSFGTRTVSVSGGTSPYTYQWQALNVDLSGSVTLSIAGADTATVNPTGSGTNGNITARFVCTVVDANGFSTTAGFGLNGTIGTPP